MMASGGTQYVDELQEIESTIAVIKEKIAEINASSSGKWMWFYVTHMNPAWKLQAIIVNH